MTYYGASVIHPTIKPLANHGIPLLVKNFDNPDLPGTKFMETKVRSTSTADCIQGQSMPDLLPGDGLYFHPRRTAQSDFPQRCLNWISGLT